MNHHERRLLSRNGHSELNGKSETVTCDSSLEYVRLNPEDMQIQIAEPGSLLRNQASNIVNHVYNELYNPGGELIDLAHDKFDDEDTTETLVLTQHINGEPVVLQTFRILYGDELDFYDLFDMEQGEWPHTSLGKKAGELGRLAYHPALRNNPSTDKQQLLRQMWPVAMNRFSEVGVEVPYFVLAPHVERFVNGAGIDTLRIDHAVPRRTSSAMALRSTFRDYWKPDANVTSQPGIYIASPYLLPHEEE